MGVSQVIFNNSSLIDLTQDTVTPESLLQGYTAHAANGAGIVGTASGGGGGETNDEDLFKLMFEDDDEEYVSADIFSRWYIPYNIIKYNAYNTYDNQKSFYVSYEEKNLKGLEVGNNIKSLSRSFYGMPIWDDFNLIIPNTISLMREPFIQSNIYFNLYNVSPCFDIGNYNLESYCNLFKKATFVLNYNRQNTSEQTTANIFNNKRTLNININHNINNISKMFRGVYPFHYIDSKNIIHENIKDCSYIFQECSGFTGYYYNGFSDSIIIPNNCNAKGMFYNASLAKSNIFYANLSDFKPIINNIHCQNVDMSYMFSTVQENNLKNTFYTIYFNNYKLDIEGDNINISHFFDNRCKGRHSIGSNSYDSAMNFYNTYINITGNNINASYFFANTGISSDTSQGLYVYINGGKNINLTHFFDNSINVNQQYNFNISINNISILDLSYFYNNIPCDLRYSYFYINGNYNNIIIDTLIMNQFGPFPFGYNTYIKTKNLYINGLGLWNNSNTNITINNAKNVELGGLYNHSLQLYSSSYAYTNIYINNIDNLSLKELFQHNKYFHKNFRLNFILKNINNLNMAYMGGIPQNSDIGIVSFSLQNINKITNLSHAFSPNDRSTYFGYYNSIGYKYDDFYTGIFNMTYNRDYDSIITLNNVDLSYIMDSSSVQPVFTTTNYYNSNMHIHLNDCNAQGAFVYTGKSSASYISYNCPNIYINANNSDLSKMFENRTLTATSGSNQISFRIDSYNTNCENMFANFVYANTSIYLNGTNCKYTNMFRNGSNNYPYTSLLYLYLNNPSENIAGIFNGCNSRNSRNSFIIMLYTYNILNIKEQNLFDDTNTTPLSWTVVNEQNGHCYYYVNNMNIRLYPR